MPTGAYPSHDIDLLLINPAGEVITDAATLDIPERLHIDNPAAGEWQAIVLGYLLHGFEDGYELRIVDQNGHSLEED